MEAEKENMNINDDDDNDDEDDDNDEDDDDIYDEDKDVSRRMNYSDGPYINNTSQLPATYVSLLWHCASTLLYDLPSLNWSVW